MSSISIQGISSRRAVKNPLGSRLFGALFAKVYGVVAALFAAAPAAPRGAVQEARELREFAESVQRSDPRFAADLFAAADRHERVNGMQG